ncbi:MAG: hypothetical protein E7A85_08180 [Anaerococcus sp.]|nr:hypothetical protein [Anaerococcus sp.]
MKQDVACGQGQAMRELLSSKFRNNSKRFPHTLNARRRGIERERKNG